MIKYACLSCNVCKTSQAVPNSVKTKHSDGVPADTVTSCIFLRWQEICQHIYLSSTHTICDTKVPNVYLEVQNAFDFDTPTLHYCSLDMTCVEKGSRRSEFSHIFHVCFRGCSSFIFIFRCQCGCLFTCKLLHWVSWWRERFWCFLLLRFYFYSLQWARTFSWPFFFFFF